eukprot:gene48034-58838_t
MFGKELFQSGDINLWNDVFARYDEAVAAVAAKKKKPELPQLDQFVFNQIPEMIENRNPRHLELAELSKLVKWKLTRGKMRPLQKMVDSNSAQAVRSCSTEAFQKLTTGDWQGAIASFSELKGVGVATASALLAAVSPELCIFMADEVIESADIPRNYDMKTYVLVRNAYLRKARELGEGWDMQKVGQAVWTASVLGLSTLADTKGEDNVSSKDCDRIDSDGGELQAKKRRKIG